MKLNRISELLKIEVSMRIFRYHEKFAWKHTKTCEKVKQLPSGFEMLNICEASASPLVLFLSKEER